jgi:hypothetical protein
MRGVAVCGALPFYHFRAGIGPITNPTSLSTVFFPFPYSRLQPPHSPDPRPQHRSTNRARRRGGQCSGSGWRARASANRGRTDVNIREGDGGGKEAVAWGSRRCQGRGCRDGGFTNLPREGDGGKNRHKKLYMSRASKTGPSACEFNDLQGRLVFGKAIEWHQSSNR